MSDVLQNSSSVAFTLATEDAPVKLTLTNATIHGTPRSYSLNSTAAITAF